MRKRFQKKPPQILDIDPNSVHFFVRPDVSKGHTMICPNPHLARPYVTQGQRPPSMEAAGKAIPSANIARANIPKFRTNMNNNNIYYYYYYNYNNNNNSNNTRPRNYPPNHNIDTRINNRNKNKNRNMNRKRREQRQVRELRPTPTPTNIATRHSAAGLITTPTIHPPNQPPPNNTQGTRQHPTLPSGLNQGNEDSPVYTVGRTFQARVFQRNRAPQ